MDKKINEKKFTVNEAAEFLGIHPISVRRKIADKSLGHYRYSEKILIGESHLEELVRKTEVKAR
jgi:excisionase family DNA binding protein